MALISLKVRAGIGALTFVAVVAPGGSCTANASTVSEHGGCHED
jgi:hypothetical protein